MKEIPLTQGKVAIVDDCDYHELVKFKWYAFKSHGVWHAMRHQHKTVGNLKTVSIFMHRWLLGLQPGDKRQVDHKNHDGLDQRRENVRICNPSQNASNRRLVLHTSQYKGVSWYKTRNKWRSGIEKNYKVRHLGYFDDEVEAAKAYDRAAIQYFGEFAKLNF